MPRQILVVDLYYLDCIRFVRSVIRIFVIINVEMSPAQLKKKTGQSNSNLQVLFFANIFLLSNLGLKYPLILSR